MRKSKQGWFPLAMHNAVLQRLQVYIIVCSLRDCLNLCAGPLCYLNTMYKSPYNVQFTTRESFVLNRAHSSEVVVAVHPVTQRQASFECKLDPLQTQACC